MTRTAEEFELPPYFLPGWLRNYTPKLSTDAVHASTIIYLPLPASDELSKTTEPHKDDVGAIKDKKYEKRPNVAVSTRENSGARPLDPPNTLSSVAPAEGTIDK